MQITCHKYDSMKKFVETHNHDFAVYMIDVLPLDELYINGGVTSYVGSAGAGPTRLKESKSRNYRKGTVGGRYRDSYLASHTRSQEARAFTFSLNECTSGLTKKQDQVYCDIVNTPGYKSEEREHIGVLECQLYRVINDLGLAHNNGEVPKHITNTYSQMSTKDYFTVMPFTGDVPWIVQIARGDITLEEVRALQKQDAIDRHKVELQKLAS